MESRKAMIKTYDFVLGRVLVGIIVDELRRVDLLANATLAFERDLSLKRRENQKRKLATAMEGRTSNAP